MCPNGHIYFVQNCTWPMALGTCEICGAQTGGQGHYPTAGNRRVGRIDANGQLQTSDAQDPLRFGAQRATYDAQQRVPKGYVDVGTASDTPREMSVVASKIVRLM